MRMGGEGKRQRFVSFHFDRLVLALERALQTHDLRTARLLFCELLPVLARVPDAMLSAAVEIYRDEAEFSVGFLRFLQMCFAKLPEHRLRIIEAIVGYYVRFDRAPEAFEYVEGHLLVAPFRDAAGLHAVTFQLAVQAWHRERRPVVRAKVLKRARGHFERYLETAAAADPQVCRLYVELLRANRAPEAELRGALEALLAGCPGCVSLQAYGVPGAAAGSRSVASCWSCCWRTLSTTRRRSRGGRWTCWRGRTRSGSPWPPGCWTCSGGTRPQVARALLRRGPLMRA